MGQLVYILGRSGTGKSYSLRNFDRSKIALINIQGKILPFRGSAEIESISTDDSMKIVSAVKSFAKKGYKSIIIDDFQYVMANEFMRRAMEGGWDRFTEIGRHAWDIPMAIRDIPEDVIVYILCHTDTDQEGTERLKTIGKMLDEKIVLEGMSTIVLKTNVSDGKYCFLTQNNGKDTTKSPAGMFPSYAIDNDLKYVDDAIRTYYGFTGARSAEEMAEADQEAAREVVKEEKKRRRRGTTESPASTETEEPKKGIKQEKEEAQIAAANECAMNVPESDEGSDSVSFEETKAPEVFEPLRRRRRNRSETTDTETKAIGDIAPEKMKSEDQGDVEPESEAADTEEAPKRRRRRR